MSTAVIEAETEPSLDQLLAAFDPKLHGGEVMAGGAVGVEAFAHGNATKNKAPYAVETPNGKNPPGWVGCSSYRVSAGGGKPTVPAASCTSIRQNLAPAGAAAKGKK